MSLESRIRELEEQARPPVSDEPQVVIYQPGEQPPSIADGRLRVYIPDNGRGPVQEAACQ